MLTLLGSVRSSLAQRLSVSDNRVALLLTALNLVLIPLLPVAGLVIDQVGVEHGLIAGSLLAAVALSLLALRETLTGALSAVVLIGAAVALLLTGSTVLMPAAFFDAKAPAAVNLGHVFVGLGAVLVLAWEAPTMTSAKLEIILFLIGIGFGPTAPLTQVALQNIVPIQDLGAGLGTMNFARTLVGSILIAIFGAIILAKAPLGAPAGTLSQSFLGSASVSTFALVFFAIAATLAVAFLSLFLLEEKPLEATHPGLRR